jgi:hypothetical protein
MPLTQYQADQDAYTKRMSALQGIGQGLGNSIQAYQGTKREQALLDQQNRETAFKYRAAGYDVTPEMVAQSNAEEPSGFAKFFGAKSPERPDLFANRTQEYKTQLSQAADDRAFKRKVDTADMNYKISQAAKDNQYKDAQIANMGAQNQKTVAEANKLSRESANGKTLTATEIGKFNEGNQIPSMLDDLETTITNNKDMFGPIAGRWASMSPWDERAKTAESQLTAAAQTVGKHLEGGVLRAEDVPKYRKMLPDMSDTPEVAANKLATVRRLLVNRQNSDVEALKNGGYDVSSIDKGLVAPGAPKVLAGGNKKVANEANAADPVALKQHLKSVSREEKIRMLQGK